MPVTQNSNLERKRKFSLPSESTTVACSTSSIYSKTKPNPCGHVSILVYQQCIEEEEEEERTDQNISEKNYPQEKASLSGFFSQGEENTDKEERNMAKKATLACRTDM